MENSFTKRKNIGGSIAVALFISLAFMGCESKYAYKKVDISGIESNIRFERFDEDFSKITDANYDEYTNQLRAKYGTFYDDYVSLMMNFGKTREETDTALAIRRDIIGFLGDSGVKNIFDTVKNVYPDMDKVESDLNLALRHFYYYFPQKKITKAYTFVSELSFGSITYSDSILAVGLDMYLGEQFPLYEAFGVPRYMARKLNKDYIALNCMEVLYQLHFSNNSYNENSPLIDAMIEEGKKLYFLECMLPAAHDSVIIGYTSTQEKFCRESEKQIWEFFVSRDLLYSVNIMDHKRYTADGPSTSGMPQDAPGKTGAWAGWQIVRKFMRDSKGKVSLQELLTHTDTKTIISKAKYKP